MAATADTVPLGIPSTGQNPAYRPPGEFRDKWLHDARWTRRTDGLKQDKTIGSSARASLAASAVQRAACAVDEAQNPVSSMALAGGQVHEGDDHGYSTLGCPAGDRCELCQWT